MPKQTLSTDEQIEKLKQVMRIANEAAASAELVRKVGAVTLYAGIVDFLTFQLARLKNPKGRVPRAVPVGE